MKHNYRIKIACFLSILSISNFEFNKNICAKNILNTKRQMSWSERNPVLAKISKALGISALLAALGFSIHYGANHILDKIYPERIEEREKLKNMGEKLNEINNKIENYTLKDGLSEDEEKNLERLRKKEFFLKERIESKNNINIKNKALNLAAVGGAVFLAKGFIDTVNAAGKFAKSLATISYLKWAFNNFAEMSKGVKNFFKSPPKEMSKEDALELFDAIFEDCHGQEEALSKLKRGVFDILVARDKAKYKGEEYSKCDVIYLYGPSGVGKSLVARRLPSVLLDNGEALIIPSSYFNKAKEESIVDQLLNDIPNSDKPSMGKIFLDYIRNNPYGMIIFEEWDKICTPELEEVIRGLIDDGILYAGGRPLKWSGIIVMTANDDDLSMEGFDPKNAKDLDEANIKKGFTRVTHSTSLLNRINKIKFKDLVPEALKKAIQDKFYQTSSYWASPDNGGIEITLDEDSLNRLALEVAKQKQGARPVEQVITGIDLAIVEKIKNLIKLSCKDKNEDDIDNTSDLSDNISLIVKYENNKFSVLESNLELNDKI